MQRRKFIKNACLACITGFAMVDILESCGISTHINGVIEGENIIVPLKEFEIIKNGKSSFKKYLIIQNDKLKYPICLYRNDEKSYNAIWLMCTHQGAELQVFAINYNAQHTVQSLIKME